MREILEDGVFASDVLMLKRPGRSAHVARDSGVLDYLTSAVAAGALLPDPADQKFESVRVVARSAEPS